MSSIARNLMGVESGEVKIVWAEDPSLDILPHDDFVPMHFVGWSIREVDINFLMDIDNEELKKLKHHKRRIYYASWKNAGLVMAYRLLGCNSREEAERYNSQINPELDFNDSFIQFFQKK